MNTATSATGPEPTIVRDVVVVIPGIMGSELVDKSGKLVWSLRARSLVEALRTLGGSIRALKLPDGIGDGEAPDGVHPGGLLGGLHIIPGIWSPVAGYGGLLKFLRSSRFHFVEPDTRDPDLIPNLLTFPYDWRLSNRHNARVLKQKACSALERWKAQPGMEEAKLVLVCHSMGGLIARWFLECEGGAEVTRSLITIGTPHRGSPKALKTLADGLEPGIGPLRVPLTELARSMPSLYQLLPTFRCLVQPGPEATRLSLADVSVPDLSGDMLKDAISLHDVLARAPEPAYRMYKVVGIRQPTATTATVTDRGVLLSTEIDGQQGLGDGTVPRLAAEPLLGHGREVHEVADQHGELQHVRSTLDLIDGIITREELIWEGIGPEEFGVEMSELWSPSDRPELRVPDLEDRRLTVTVFDEAGAQVTMPRPVEVDGRASLDPLPPGGYRARVGSSVPGGPAPVTASFLVWDPTTDVDGDDAVSG